MKMDNWGQRSLLQWAAGSPNNITKVLYGQKQMHLQERELIKEKT